MNNRILLVVGDKFAAYIQGKDAITVSQLRGLLSLSIHLLPTRETTVLVPGQGLGDKTVKRLLEEASTSPNLAHFDFSLWHQMPKRAASSLSHKHIAANTLISEPRQRSADTYTLHLLIDEDCELMNDHQTGQHIQGMVLIEATRQTLLAVTEKFLLPRNDIDYAFVFNGLSVSYNHYAFPVSAVLRCVITEAVTANLRRLSFSAEVFVEQCGQVVTSFTASFGAMEKQRISKMENILAVKTQAEYLARVAAHMHCNPASLGQVENL